MKREIHVCDGEGCGKPLLSHSDGLVFKGELTSPTGEKVFEAPADQEVALCWSCLEKTKPAQVNPFTQPMIPFNPPTIPFTPEYPGIVYPYPSPGQPIYPITSGDRITIGDPPPGMGTIIISGDAGNSIPVVTFGNADYAVLTNNISDIFLSTGVAQVC